MKSSTPSKSPVSASREPTSPMHQGDLLTRAQVSRRLGVCQHTIQRLTKKGLLPAHVFNRRLIRYAPETVEKFIKSAVKM
jgi:excisionase family DNA binding protein